MKILFVCAIELNTEGGPKTHIVEMVREWHKLGHEIWLLVPFFDQRKIKLPVRIRHYPFAGYSFFRRLVTYVFLFLALIRLLIAVRPAAVYERQMEYNPLIFFACRLLKVPLFVEINGLISEDLRLTGAPDWAIRAHEIVEKKEMAHSTGVMCTSPRLREIICSGNRNLGNKTTFIPNGANLELFRPMDRRFCRDKMGLDPQLRYIGFVGTFSHLHQPEQAVRSFARVREKIHDARLLMVGDGPRRKGCEQLAQNLGVSSHVTFTGLLRYEEVPVAINCMDVGLVIASRERLVREGVVAFKFQELLACGCPVVAHFLKPEESVRYSGVAKMAPVGDEAALDRALFELLGNPAEAAHMAERALRYVAEHVSWEKSAQLSIDFMSRMIKRGPVADE